MPSGLAVSAALGFREIISQSGWFREKQTVTWFIFSPQMFLCFLSHTQIVQLIKESIAVDFFGEAFAGEIWEQHCVSPWCKREDSSSLVFMGILHSGISIPSKMQLSVFHCSSHLVTKESLEKSTSFVIQVSQITFLGLSIITAFPLRKS